MAGAAYSRTSDLFDLERPAARPVKTDEAVLTLAEVQDRTAAEALKGTELYVPRAALPATMRWLTREDT